MKKHSTTIICLALTAITLAATAWNVATHTAPADAQTFGSSSSAINGIAFKKGSADPTAGAGVACTRPCLYVRTGTDELYLKTGSGSTAWSEAGVSGGTIASLTTTGRVTAAGLTLSSGGDVSTPAINFTGATNYGVYKTGNYIAFAIGGSDNYYLGPNGAVNTGVDFDFRSVFRLTGDAAATVSADQNNYAGPTNGATLPVWYLTPDANPRNLTGIVAKADGAFQLVINASGTNGLVLKHASGSSTAANQIYGPNAADITIRPYGMALLVYSSANTRWHAVAL